MFHPRTLALILRGIGGGGGLRLGVGPGHAGGGVGERRRVGGGDARGLPGAGASLGGR